MKNPGSFSLALVFIALSGCTTVRSGVEIPTDSDPEYGYICLMTAPYTNTRISVVSREESFDLIEKNGDRIARDIMYSPQATDAFDPVVAVSALLLPMGQYALFRLPKGENTLYVARLAFWNTYSDGRNKEVYKTAVFPLRLNVAGSGVSYYLFEFATDPRTIDEASARTMLKRMKYASFNADNPQPGFLTGNPALDVPAVPGHDFDRPSHASELKGEQEPVPAVTADPAAAAEANSERDGFTPETAFIMPRRSIKVEGKLDTWDGIEPFIDNRLVAATFLGSIDYGISKVFLCRDDEFLYWRVDFVTSNPMRARPKNIVEQLEIELTIEPTKTTRLFIGQTFYPSDMSTRDFAVFREELTKEKTQLTGVKQKNANGATAFVGRLRLSSIQNYCQIPAIVWVNVAHERGKGVRENARTARLFVDFSK